MKKKFFVVLLIMAFWPLAAIADDVTVRVYNNTRTSTSQYQAQGGGNGGTTTKIRSYISPYMDTDFLMPPRTYPPGRVVAYTEDGEIPYWKLDHLPLKKLLEKYRREGDIIQYEKKFKLITENKRGIKLLPGRLPEPAIWSVCYDSPANGFVRETVRRAASVAKAGTNTDRVFIQVETYLNPWTAGNAISAGGGSSFMPSVGAWAFGAQPQIGKSESRVYPVYKVTIYCYQPGPIPRQGKQKASRTTLKILLFKNEKLTNNNAIKQNADWLAKNFGQIEKIKIYGQGKNTEEITRTAVYAVGNALVERGLPAEKIARILEGIPGSTTPPRISPPQTGVTGAVWLEILKRR